MPSPDAFLQQKAVTLFLSEALLVCPSRGGGDGEEEEEKRKKKGKERKQSWAK